MVFLDDVVVPARNLIGKENQGFKMIVKNFNHERFIIACQYCRMARLAYESDQVRTRASNVRKTSCRSSNHSCQVG